jgi:hypothetical protein
MPRLLERDWSMKTHGFILSALFVFSLSCQRTEIIPKFQEDTKTPVAIQVTPASTFISTGLILQHTATLIYEDGTTDDITDLADWIVTGNAAEGAQPGSIVAGAAGTATVSAEFDALSSTATGADAQLRVTNDYLVSPAGSDLGTGLSDDPFLTIEHAIAQAALSPGKNVLIQQGDYYTPQITLVEGVSLLGGYDANWVRDVVNNRARIFDSSLFGGDACCGYTPKAAVYADATITNGTLIEGLEIYGSTAPGMNLSSAFYAGGGSPTLRNCRLSAGSGLAYSYGVYISQSASMLIEYCEIHGGSSDASLGIRLVHSGGSGVVIRSSVIDGGTGLNSNAGILLENNVAVPSPSIYNNLITCGTGGTDTATGITVAQSSQPVIANNTIVAGSAVIAAIGINLTYSGRPYCYNNVIYLPAGTDRYGLYEAYSGADPLEVLNNVIYNAVVLYRDYVDGVSWNDWTIIGDMELNLALDGTVATGNDLTDPVFAGAGDFHLGATSPAVVTAGGLNGVDEGWIGFPVDASSNPVDIEGNPRPGAGGGGWSMGAYQYP